MSSKQSNEKLLDTDCRSISFYCLLLTAYFLLLMALEIEKKYRLGSEEREPLVGRLREAGAERVGHDFEENVVYAGGTLDHGRSVLRLRRTGKRATLTYKERYPSTSSIKQQREEETVVENADATVAILEALGYKPSLVYEKRRETWRIHGIELVIDELPFGLFLELEGEEDAILEAERLLDLSETEAEMATYPQLAATHGTRRGEMIEARFEKEERP